jgi:Phage integrase family
MDPCYRSLLEQVDDRYARDMLSPFFRFLSAESIQLNLVRNSHAEAYQAYRRDTSFGKVKRSQHRALVRHWNACAARIAGWPKIELTEPPYSSRFTGPTWEDFPQGLRDDIDAYCERITIRAPVRMQNLASICIGINLIRPGGPGAPYMLVFPDHDTKNGVPLEFAFDETTTAMIDEYIYQHRPQLMQGFDHDWLFAVAGRKQKDTKTLSEQISKPLWKELWLEATPHQFRHAAAYIMLKADPGNYELVRRVLGHRSITTTRNFYIGLETLEATRLFGEMVTDLARGEPPGKPLRKKTHA